jgi:hypothetical protein
MSRSRQIRVTRKMRAVDANLIEVNCCEAQCGMSILVDKSEYEQSRKIRCVACTMRARSVRP